MEGLLQCLHGILNEDKDVRQKSEQALNFLSRSPGYGVLLSQIMINETISIDYRQLSGLLLKRFVRGHWDESGPHPVPQDERHIIKQILPQALQLPYTKIRTAAAMAIASIAHWDWPDKWPGLVQSLLDCLSNPNPHLVEGAICCLEMIASGENSSDQQLPGLIQSTFPPLLMVLSNTTSQQFDDRIKMRAVVVVSSCLEWLSVTKMSNATDVTINALSPMLPQWFASFRYYLSVLDQGLQFYGLKIAILQTILILLHHFPGQIKTDIQDLMEPIWKSLLNIATFYEELAVQQDGLSDMDVREGESPGSVGLEPYVATLFEVFHALAYKTKFRHLLQPHLHQLFYLTLGFMQMTEEQIGNYQADPNQWMADEEDETLEFSVRISTSKFIQELFHAFKSDSLQPFAEAVTKRLHESQQNLQNGKKNWWKLRECVIYSVGMVSEDLQQYYNKNQSVFDLKSFSKSVLLNDLYIDVPYLRGRALWCASLISKTFALEEISPFLEVASSILNSTDRIPVKIFACRAVGNFCPRLQPPAVGLYIDGLMNGLVSIINDLSKETLYLLLETFHVLLSLSEDVSKKYLKVIISNLLVLWAHNYKDGVLVSHFMDIVHVFAQFPSCNALLQETMSTTLNNLLQQYDKHQYTVVETTIDLVAAIVMPAKELIHPLLMDSVFPLLCNLMMASNDNGILQAGTSALRAYARNGNSILINWKHPSGETGLSMLLSVIHRLLEPTIPDAASMSIGFLIDKLMTNYKQHIGGVLDALLTRVLRRLHESKDSTLKEGLLMVFVRLFLMDVEQSVGYLLSKDNGGLLELSYILREWTTQHSDFRGSFKIKMSIVGLSKIFQCIGRNSCLSSVTVLGDLVESPGSSGGGSSAGVEKKTRSKSKKTAVCADESLSLKIFKILVREYQVIIENEAEPLSLSDSYDEAKWEDDEDDDETMLLRQLAKASSGQGLDPNVVTALSGAGGESPFVAQETFAYLDEIIGNEKIETEEKEDPDILQDALYTINLKEFITSFLKSFQTQNPNNFMLISSQLPPMDKECLQNIMHQ